MSKPSQPPGLPTGCDPSDFLVETGRSEHGTFVRVVHTPTGMSECVYPIGIRAPEDVARELLGGLAAEIPPLVPWPLGLTEEIRRLIPLTPPEPGLPTIPDALPVTWDLFAYVFLGATGVVVAHDASEDTISYTSDGRRALQILAIASRSQSSLAAFVPAPPDDAPPCPLCHGSGAFKERTCPRCGALGRLYGFRLPSPS
jgi:hypothetical protein